MISEYFGGFHSNLQLALLRVQVHTCALSVVSPASGYLGQTALQVTVVVH